MAKSLREQLAGLGLVSEYQARMEEEASKVRFLHGARRQIDRFGGGRVLADYGAAVQDRRAARRDYSDLIVEYKRGSEKSA